MDWGDVPSWVTSVATVLALVFAAWAAIVARRLHGIESQRDESARKAREEEQAALVSAWCNRQNGIWGVYVRNASQIPVYDGQLSVVDLRDATDQPRALEIPVVPAGETSFYSLPPETDLRAAADLRVELSFTDSAGTRWFRDKRGRLSKLKREVVFHCDRVREGALTDFARRHLADHGVAARFEIHEFVGLRAAFLAATRSDILIAPHDWIPELVGKRLLDPISLPAERQAEFVDVALAAVRYDGRLYGVPYSLDTVALLRNTELVPDPPATMEQLTELGLALAATGQVERPLAIWPDPFHLQPLYSSAGGELFAARPDGSIRAFERLRALGRAGVLRPDVAEDVESIELFQRRAAPFAIVPARVLAELTGDPPYEVQPVPPFADGGRPVPYVAVNAFMLATRGENKGITNDLITDYATREANAVALYRAQPRPLALRAPGDKVRRDDPRLAVYHDECLRGALMPALPRMADVWRLFHGALLDVIRGDSPAGTARRLHGDLSRLPG